MDNPTVLAPLFGFLEYTLSTAQNVFDQLPGSAVIQRYVKSSHQNDPGRTLLELILIVFAIRTLLQSRTRAEKSGKHFIKFSENVCLLYSTHTLFKILLSPFLQEIDELVDEWIPEPLAQPLSTIEASDLAAVPVIAGPNGPKPKLVSTGKTAVNLASYNFTGLSGNEHIKQRAVEILRKYGLGSCGPPGFYGTLGKLTSFFYSCWGDSSFRVQMFIWILRMILQISSVLKPPSCTHKAFPPYLRSFQHSVNVGISLSPTVA